MARQLSDTIADFVSAMTAEDAAELLNEIAEAIDAEFATFESETVYEDLGYESTRELLEEEVGTMTMEEVGS